MSNPSIIALTGQGVIKQTYQPDGVFYDLIPGTGDSRSGAVSTDSKNPYLWIIDDTAAAVKKIRLSNTGDVSSPILYLYNAVNIQEDHSTGNIFILVSDYPDFKYHLVSSSSSSPSSESQAGEDTTKKRGWLVKYDISLGTVKIFKPLEKGSELALRGPKDCKLDHARRMLWVTECGNDDIVGINADTGLVMVKHSLRGMICPTVLTFSSSTGDIFVRAYSSSDSKEHIYRFGENGFISAFRGSNAAAQGDIRENISSGRIAVPSSDSIKYDYIRNRLWWVSGPEDKTVYMVDTVRSTGRALSLLPELPSSSSSSHS